MSIVYALCFDFAVFIATIKTGAIQLNFKSFFFFGNMSCSALTQR